MSPEVREEYVKIMSDKAFNLRKQIEDTPWYKFRTLSKLRQERREAVLGMTAALCK